MAEAQKVYIAGVIPSACFIKHVNSIDINNVPFDLTPACYDFDYDHSPGSGSSARWWVHLDAPVFDPAIHPSDRRAVVPSLSLVSLLGELCAKMSKERDWTSRCAPEREDAPIRLSAMTATDSRNKLPEIVWFQAQAYIGWPARTRDGSREYDRSNYWNSVKCLCELVGYSWPWGDDDEDLPSSLPHLWGLIEKGWHRATCELKYNDM